MQVAFHQITVPLCTSYHFCVQSARFLSLPGCQNSLGSSTKLSARRSRWDSGKVEGGTLMHTRIMHWNILEGYLICLYCFSRTNQAGHSLDHLEPLHRNDLLWNVCSWCNSCWRSWHPRDPQFVTIQPTDDIVIYCCLFLLLYIYIYITMNLSESTFFFV